MGYKQKIIATFCVATFVLQIAFADTGEISSDQRSVDDANFLGISKSKSAKILDNFNERQKELLFENLPITSEDEEIIFDSDKKKKALENALQKVREKKDVLKIRKHNITRKKITLKNALKNLDASIITTMRSILEKEKEITNKNNEIKDYNEKIADLNEKIASNKKVILNYLRYIYLKGDGIYDQENEVDAIRTIILNDGDISEALNDIHYKSLLELSGQNLVDTHRSLAKDYYVSKQNVKKAKSEAMKMRSDLKIQKKELGDQKKYKQELLEITKGQESMYAKIIEEKEQREERVETALEEVENDYAELFNNIGNKYNCRFDSSSGSTGSGSTGTGTLGSTGATTPASGSGIRIQVEKNQHAPVKAILQTSTGGVAGSGVLLGASGSTSASGAAEESGKCKDLEQYFDLERKIREDSDVTMNDQNPLSWPAEPERGISTFYHDEEYYNQLGSEHGAIDIRYSQGTDLVAPAPGYVYLLSMPRRGSYSYIALKHADGFVTVYGHVSKVFVKKFGYVKKGEVFAKSGGAPGTPGAGPMTSGPHLHFEVFKDRKNVDPLRYMDITHLRFEELGLKYRYKYIEDLKLKYGNRVNLSKFQRFYIAGDSEMERQKYLLQTYASSAFNDWDIWTEEALDGQVDPSFLICVGLAETGLGKHLKTPYNVGNIGNTDSGGTYDFVNAREGIYWMVRTLNNRYLGKYSTIDMLSRWGNKSGSIYASSSKNWHNNIVKCLSALKGRFIEDNYRFRISEAEDY